MEGRRATTFPANSPIDALPFVTNFNTGQGNLYAIRRRGFVGRSGWNNLSLQDVLPTWRWIVQSGGTKLVPSLDWSDAYWGGTSLLISGTLDAVNDIPLYETELDVDANTALVIVSKTGAVGMATHLSIGLAFADAPSVFEYFDVGDSLRADWDPLTFDLAPFAGRTVAAVALRVTPDASSAPYSIHVGRLGIYDLPPPIPQPPSDVQVVATYPIGPDSQSVRLTWSPSPATLNSYAVFQHHADGSLTWLGGTTNTAYFVAGLTRDGNEATSTIDVEAVGPEFFRSDPASATVLWDSIFADGFDSAGNALRH